MTLELAKLLLPYPGSIVENQYLVFEGVCANLVVTRCGNHFYAHVEPKAYFNAATHALVYYHKVRDTTQEIENLEQLIVWFTLRRHYLTLSLPKITH